MYMQTHTPNVHYTRTSIEGIIRDIAAAMLCVLGPEIHKGLVSSERTEAAQVALLV